MQVEFNASDIGPNILLYLTKGLYLDPRDILREYIQNSVDSKAKHSVVHVGTDYVCIEDDGLGMNSGELRQSIQLARSKKDKSKNVGYKGIGIYSAMNFASTLYITSKQGGHSRQIKIDLAAIHARIESADQENFPDITDILSSTIEITEVADFSFIDLHDTDSGTQVWIEGLTESATRYFRDETELLRYFRRSLPLKFDPEFTFGEAIEEKINQRCISTDQVYRSISLKLLGDSSTTSASLCLPYTMPIDGLQEYVFKEIKINDGEKEILVGVIWGCLHNTNKVIPVKLERGFLIKKHGFSIGNNETAMSYFQFGKKFFNRFIGEIILLSPELIPNAARNDLEFNKYSELFKKELRETIKKYFEDPANEFQETTKAEEAIQDLQQQAESFTADSADSELERLKGVMQSLEKRLKDRKEFIKSDVRNKAQKELARAQQTIESKDNQQPTTDSTDSGTNSIQSPPSSNRINRSPRVQEILSRMNEAGNAAPPEVRKLKQLYDSLCAVSLKHAVLMHCGVWVLWEILGKIVGEENTNNPYGVLATRLSKFKQEGHQNN
ncbi:MAG: ATP-binding protein [Gammaproteobacteria bacterium]|nr:ATP-binding protein [Gammaproteobacteria bacterium]